MKGQGKRQERQNLRLRAMLSPGQMAPEINKKSPQ